MKNSLLQVIGQQTRNYSYIQSTSQEQNKLQYF